ncbi:stage III sporulation protein AG [Oscillibacter sp.]|uniref:stage III sporulation protein AG n=1 Tax=Oscillibacter sp. TaxID=1945593 RepID=UPI00260E3C24|nr:stage III sporulation protein AG [Oscillibacter sp.]MDD3346331.1 stage III sporulation protein AG [Oscillibacter sp.]
MEMTKAKGVQTLWDRYKYVALVVLIGAGLLLWPSGNGAEGKRDSGESLAVESDLQGEMEEILGTISGVGQVRVLLTVDTDGERQLARDTELTYSGATASPEDYSRKSETVLVDGGAGDEMVVTKTLYPTYRGALVVCQGGEAPAVRLAVTEAVAALTGLSSDHITVAKWQS